MTTAHRPTFEPARGGTGKGEQDLSKHSKQYSSRDLPGHTKIKYRQHGQESTEEIKGKDLKKDLEDRERTIAREKRGGKEPQSSIAGGSGVSSTSSKKRVEEVTSGNLDADDPLDVDDDDEDDSDEDDTAELMAELNRIKKEREADKFKLEAEREAEEQKIRTESILSGNPLLNAGVKQDFKVKRRWDDDVVFKNCAKGVDEKRKKEAGFINDALRNEFHKKFMEKYIK